MLYSFWQDITYGSRTLTKRPGFTLAAVLALGLGIGANTAIFSVVYALLFRPLPVPRSEELVSIVGRASQAGSMSVISFPDATDYRSLKSIFADVAAYQPGSAQMTADGRPERIFITVTSGNYFPTLRLSAPLGRMYLPEEGDLGAQPVIVLDYAYWQSRFGGDSGIVGKAVEINGQPATVIGVAPESFPGTLGLLRTQAYVPFSLWGRVNASLEKTLDDRSWRSWRIVARLQEGVRIEEAQAAVATMAGNLEKTYPESNREFRAFVVSEPMARLEPSAVSYLPPIAAVFMVLVSLVLLIACANAANLLLARASERRREIALRASLGAGRLRILRQLLTESLILSLLGGAAGLVLAYWAGTLLSAIRLASDFPFRLDFSIDFRIFGYAFLVAVLAGLVAGLVPAVHAARTNLTDALKEGGRTGTGGGRQRLRSLLVASQVAVSLVLLVCTALFVQSMRHVSEMDMGFDLENRLILSTDASLLDYSEEMGRAFYQDLLERVRSLPGVRSAATSRFIPLGFENSVRPVYPEGGDKGVSDDKDIRRVIYNVVSTDYFTTMGIPILEGRSFTEEDNPLARKVAVVNQRMAEIYWPGESPLGKRFSTEGAGGPFIEIIGVAKMSMYALPGEPPLPFFYLPVAQNYQAYATLFVHTEMEPTRLLPAIRSEIHAIDPRMPIFEVRTLKSHIREGKAEILFRLPAKLVGAFATIGTLLAALGLYGVIAYSVTQRTHEIGLRMALGASHASIIRLVLSRGLVMGGLGVGVGLLLALAITRTFANLLVGVAPSHAPTYAVASLSVMAVALMACYLPARFRAARIDPVTALREE